MSKIYLIPQILTSLLFLFPTNAQRLNGNESEYEFVGHHFVASLVGCDKKALTNVEELALTLEKASLASGAKILSSSKYVFPGNGMTMVVLLSESHASIHTYPEFDACFIDLFTCGHNCSAKKFEEVLENYLKPKETNKRMLLRNANTFDEEAL